MPKTWPASCKSAVKRWFDPLLKFTVGVDEDISCQGARNQRVVGNGDRQCAGVHRLGADPDVTEPRVVLGLTGYAERLPTVGHESDVDIRVHSPGLKRSQDGLLPGNCRLLGIERLKESTGMSGDRSAIGDEAQGQIPRVTPGDPERCRYGAILKKLYLKPLAPLVSGCSAHLVHLRSASHRPFSPMPEDLRARSKGNNEKHFTLLLRRGSGPAGYEPPKSLGRNCRRPESKPQAGTM